MQFSIFKGETTMESVLGIIFSAENVRMLVLLVFGFSGFIWFKTSFGNDIARLDAKIDAQTFQLNAKIDALAFQLNNRIDMLTTQMNNRIDTLTTQVNNRMDALTFVLEKNGSIKREDKEYIDSRTNEQ
jgi:hypothetical protein